MFSIPFRSCCVLRPCLSGLLPAVHCSAAYSNSPFNFNFNFSDALNVLDFIASNIGSHGNTAQSPPPDLPPPSEHTSAVEYRHQLQEARKLYKSHVPTTTLQRLVLLGGSAVGSFLAPQRDDMIATFGEVSGYVALLWMQQRMMSDATGRAVLQLKPRIRTTTVNMSALKQLPEGTFGREYAEFMGHRKFSPDARREVRYVDDEELAYVMQRYRELHDFTHTLLQMPTNLSGEIVVKWFEGVQTGLPLCVLGGLLAPLRLPAEKQTELLSVYVPWAVTCGLKSQFLMNVFLEKHFEEPIISLREKLGIIPPPKGTLTKRIEK